MKNARGKSWSLWVGSVLLACVMPLSAAWATPVAISSMLVNSASLDLTITNVGTYSFSGAVSPPAQIVMGTYQNPIYAQNISTSGITGTATIYSTGVYGEPVPSGNLDTSYASNPVSVNFSSFRLGVNLTGPLTLSFDAPAWLTTTPNSSSFDALTNAYTLGWNNNFNVVATLDGLPTTVSGNLQVTLGGTLQPVPVPATLWLFGSGFVGLVGIARRRRSAA